MTTTSVSLKDIAAAVGCSPRVAAAVLNPGNSNIRVGEATQQRIIATATELGYRANGLAQAMATGKSRVLGVIVEAGPIEHRGWMLSGAIEAAAQRGYLIKVFSFQDLPTEVVGLCLDWRLAGLLSLAIRIDQNEYLIRGTREHNIPMAILDDVPAGFEGISVHSDEMQGMHQIIEHLAALGHRDIAFLGADGQSGVSQGRASCFRTVLRKMGVPQRDEWIVNSDWGDHQIIGAAVHGLLQGERPTAIVCAGDPLAMRVYAAARAVGLDVPKDLSVIGFGNFFLSDMLDPPLTTIEQSFSEMGRVGVEHMISFLESSTHARLPAKLTARIPTQLMVRSSTAPPPGTQH